MSGVPLSKHGGLALIGSGELADASAEVHRTLMGRLGEPARPLFLDTFAGFESNIDAIDRKAIEYFRRNFALDPALARFRSGRESAGEIAAAVSAIGQSNYILAGPGSPSYGVKVLQGSPVWQAVAARWRAGAMVVFASAAAVAAGRQTIPVYEIFKAGIDPGWIAGLDLLGTIGVRAAVVPHWNNASGDGYDTRFCFMGGARFAVLERMLDAGDLVLGLDEYTCLHVGPELTGEVLGAGTVTMRREGREVVYARGDRIAFDNPVPAGAGHAAKPAAETAEPLEDDAQPRDSDIGLLRGRVEAALAEGDVSAGLDGLVALSLVAGAGLEQSLPGRAELAVQALQTMLPRLARAEQLGAARRRESRLLVDALVVARAALRRGRQWDAADELRDTLSDLGYVIADTPDGTTWSRKDDASI